MRVWTLPAIALVGFNVGACGAFDDDGPRNGPVEVVEGAVTADCNSDPWKLGPARCNPMLNRDETVIREVRSECMDGGDGWKKVVTSFSIPKIFDDGPGNFERVTVETWRHPSTAYSAAKFFRRGQDVGTYQSWSSTDHFGDLELFEARVIAGFFGRKEVFEKYRPVWEKCGAPPVEAGFGCFSCRAAEGLTVGFLAAGAIGCCSVSGVGCFGCVAGGAAAGYFVVKAMDNLCDISCALEKCEEEYNKCKQSAPTVMPIGGKDEDTCEEDYDKCRKKVISPGS